MYDPDIPKPPPSDRPYNWSGSSGGLVTGDEIRAGMSPPRTRIGKIFSYAFWIAVLIGIAICVVAVIISIVSSIIDPGDKAANEAERGESGTYHGGKGIGPGGDLTSPDYEEPPEPEPPDYPPPQAFDTMPPPEEYNSPYISCSEAGKYIGKTVTLDDKISNIQYASGKNEPMYIFLGADYGGKNCVIVAVWCDIPEWMGFMKGDKINVTGKLYKDGDGDIVMDVNHPASFFE